MCKIEAAVAACYDAKTPEECEKAKCVDWSDCPSDEQPKCLGGGCAWREGKCEAYYCDQDVSQVRNF